MKYLSEFDFPFPRFDLLLKEKTVILKLQGFRVVNIIGLNLDLARVGDLALLVTHTRMYMRVQILLKTGNGAGGWTTLPNTDTYYFSSIFIQSMEY
jgi:hypothetical protein